MSDVTRAIVAATSVAASLDLPANEATVLHNSNRLALRLSPCDVLARVAHVGHEAAQLEVELAQRLAEIGCPVGPLEPRVDPLVYIRWDRGDQFPNGRRFGEEFLRSLREGPPWPTLDTVTRRLDGP
jgi:hypothetical protein